MKKNKFLLVALFLIFSLTACSGSGQTQAEKTDSSGTGEESSDYQKYEKTFFDTFDTIVTYLAYDKSQEEFDEKAKFVEEEFHRLHKLYDNYNNYEGINNIKTVNDKAGQGPVKVDKDLLDLVEFSIRANKEISHKVDVSMGSVFGIWHDFREEGIDNPENAKLPDMKDLEAAKAHSNIDDIVIDRENMTIEILDPELRVDLGATGKGYATELVCDALEDMGVDSAILSSGGNVKVIGKPRDGRDAWGIGIQNPDNALGKSEEQTAEVLFLDHTGSVVTSGDYQRYYEVDGKVYHHIIDPDSLEPANYYHSVSILTEDSGLADFLSTAAYMLPLEESMDLVEKNGAEGFWILDDGSYAYTDGMRDYLSK